MSNESAAAARLFGVAVAVAVAVEMSGTIALWGLPPFDVAFCELLKLRCDSCD